MSSSCKGRAFCPSCLGRRMAQSAANLADHVLPIVPLRQFVVTFPLAARPAGLRRQAGLLVTGGVHPLNDEVSNHHGCLVVPSKFSVLLYFSHPPLATVAVFSRMLLVHSSSLGLKRKAASMPCFKMATVSQPVMTTEVCKFIAYCRHSLGVI